MKIGEYVKQYRKERGLSMQAFGDMCGLSRAYISILEKGINPTTGRPFAPSLITLQKIAFATHMDLNDMVLLLDGDQPIILNEKSDSLLSFDEMDLISDYRKLNSTGKEKAAEYVRDLSEQPKYTTPPAAKKVSTSSA